MKLKLKHILFVCVALFVIISIAVCAVGVKCCIDSVYATMAFAPGALLTGVGNIDLPGFRKQVLFIPEAYCTKIPAIPKSADDNTACVAAGEFAFVAGKKPIYIDCGRKTVGYSFESQGEEGSMSWLQKGEFYHPGAKKEAAAFASMVINTPGFLVFEDANGDQILMGQKGLPASIKCSGNLGKAATDAKGFTFTSEADSLVPIVYLGTPIDFDEYNTPAAASLEIIKNEENSVE